MVPDTHYLGRGFPDCPGEPSGCDNDASITGHSDISRNAGSCPCESCVGQEASKHSATSTQRDMPAQVLD